jgi:Glycosyl hydrolase family 1
VRKWTTFNEPWIVCGLQYGNGDFAPGVDYGDVGKWRCGHNLLIAHAVVVKLYRDTYKKPQDGRIGMALWSEWSEPWSDKPEGAGLLATCICDGLPADCITHVLQRCAIPNNAAGLRIFCCCCHLQTSVQLKTSWTQTLVGLPTPYTLVTIQNMCVRVDRHCGSTGHTVPEQVCALFNPCQTPPLTSHRCITTCRGHRFGATSQTCRFSLRSRRSCCGARTTTWV